MAGLLPDSVRWKAGRHHVGWRFIDICTEKRLNLLDDTILSQLSGYARIATGGGESALQCNSDGVVSEADLLYLAFWITRF